MRQLLLPALLCFHLSLSAQIYLDSLPLTSPPGDSIPAGDQVDIGYGHQDARIFNGAVTHLETRQFNQGQINDWNQLWPAQVPGFTVTRAGSNPNEDMDARIRGLRTLGYGKTQPLYVVDGVPGVDLFAVDPSDIVAVDVLRDAASTAIYGGRGSAGVVLITTRPVVAGPLRIQYQGQVSVESAAKRYTVFDEAQYVAAGGTDFSPGYLANTDWQDLALQTAVGHAHHLSLSKGLGHGFIRAGLHYRDVTGIVRESGFEQYNGSLLAGQSFWHDRLTLSAGATLGQRLANYGFPEGYRYAITFAPSAPVRSDDPAYLPSGGYVENSNFDFFNPIAIIEQNRHSGRTDFNLLHARAEFLINRHLTASLQVSEQTKAKHDLEYYSPQSKFRGAGVGGSGIAASEKTLRKNLESTLTYRFGKAGLQGELSGGYGWYHTQFNTTSINGIELLNNTWQGKTWDQYRDLLADFPSPYEDFTAFHSQSDRQLIAFFGRAQLQWRHTYFGTFSWRKEGSSNLAPATRRGVFPGFSVGVDINQWMPARPFDYFKISLGHGVTGTEMTQSGLFQRLYNRGPKFYYNGQFIYSYGTTQNPNPRLGWERSTENSLNLRFSLWGGRLVATADAYRSHSRDLIATLTKSIPPNFASSTNENVGEIEGHGAELSLHYELVKNQHFSWEIGLAATTMVSTLERFNFGADSFRHGLPGAPCGCDTYLQLLYPGVPIGTFWGPVATGVNPDGTQIYEDIDNNGYLQIDRFDKDQTNIGNAQPKWQLGLSQQLTWRNLDLNFQLEAVTGHRLFHYYRNAYETAPYISWNRVVTRYTDPTLKQTRFNNRFVEDASFLRMQYVAFGYKLPLNTRWLHSLHFQIGAQNLFTLTKYSGLDPALRLSDSGPSDNGSRSYGFSDPLLPGLDRGGTYPTARRWWLGVEAAF